MAIAKVFWSGNSQAIRLPKGLRFPADTHEVEIHREGKRLIIEAVQVEVWPESFWRAFEGMPVGFERPAQARQKRENLDL